MKRFAAVIALLAVIAGGATYWFSENLDDLVKDAIVRQGSAMTQAKVSVGAVRIAPADGKGRIDDLVVGNPSGFRTDHALRVGRIDLDIDLGSLAGNVVVIRRIAIQSPGVIYEKGEALTNFDALQRNIAAFLGPGSDRQPGRKLIVEELAIRDAKAEASAVFMNGRTIAVPLPDITLRHLGKARGGVTAGELGQEIVGAIKSRLTGAVSFDKLLKSGGAALDRAGTAIKGLLK